VILLDVNVLLYTYREDAPDHRSYWTWLQGAVRGPEPYGLSELVLSRFLRIATNARIFDPPAPLSDALAFVQALRTRPNAVLFAPGPRHWDIFTRLCAAAAVKGNLVPDAYLAALAIETGGEWVTTDRDFARFPGLRWRHPLVPGP